MAMFVHLTIDSPALGEGINKLIETSVLVAVTPGATTYLHDIKVVD